MYLGWMSKIYESQDRWDKVIKRIRDYKNPNLQVNKGSFDEVIPNHTNDFLYLDPPYYLDKDKDNKIISEGFNQVTSTNDPTAHGEIVAIRNSCKILNSFSLKGCDLYTSCEPCPMCMSAIYWARIDNVYYANTRDDAKKIDYSMCAITGLEGLLPTIKIIKFTNKIAIANKEAIICGWNLIQKELKKYNTNF